MSRSVRAITPFTLALALALPVAPAALADVVVVQAARVLAEPGKAPRGPTSIVIENGRITALLDELRLADDTLVVFASDNGGVGGYARAGLERGRDDVTDNAPLRGGIHRRACCSMISSSRRAASGDGIATVRRVSRWAVEEMTSIALASRPRVSSTMNITDSARFGPRSTRQAWPVTT